MKNIIIAILAVSTLVAGYVVAAGRLRLSIQSLEGKTVTIGRGDLTLPINATGTVHPYRRVEIKAEASGEVIEIAKHAGDRVRAGEPLIRLQRDEEERNVNRAKLDVDVRKAHLEDMKITLQQARTADLDRAKAQVDQLEESVRFAKFRMDKLTDLPPHQRNDEEMLDRETTYRRQLAQLDGAKADLERSKLAIPRQEQAVIQAQAAYDTAKNFLGDAQKRLSKTNIVSPIDGIVADITVDIGEVIQGGRDTFTGGTVLAVVLDMEKVVVRAEVDEADIGRVLAIAPEWSLPGHEGTARMPKSLNEAAAAIEHLPTITVESFPDEEFQGIIERIYPEPKNRSSVVTYDIDVVILSENQDMLLSGLRADVEFTTEHVENVVLCPNEAIRKGPSGTLGVYVPKESASGRERSVTFVSCEFGLDNGNYSEVRTGLIEGMVVYTKLPVKLNRDRDRKKRN